MSGRQWRAGANAGVVTVARLTMSQAVEQIARELDGPRRLDEIAREAARRTGRRLTDYTPRTAAEALARLPFIVRCGRGTYAPARVALDGKAFSVPLRKQEIETGRLSTERLEPFYTALQKPPVLLRRGWGFPVADRLPASLEQCWPKEAAVKGESPLRGEFLPPQRFDLSLVLEQGRVVRDGDASRGAVELASGFIDLTPLWIDMLPHPPRPPVAALDLVLRWDRRAGALTGEVWPWSESEPKRTAVVRENRILADFLASRLLRDHAVPLGPLLLEAYARFPELGSTPGSAPWEVVTGDPRMRVTAGDGDWLDGVAIARAGTPTWYERSVGLELLDDEHWVRWWQTELRRRIKEHPHKLAASWKLVRRRLGLSDAMAAGARGKVVLLRKPSHAELLAEWDRALTVRGVSGQVRRRKVHHVEAFVNCLESGRPSGGSHLLDVDETDLRSFFFGTYIQRFPHSHSDALSFIVDLRDFYRHQQRMGRIADARFAELIHGVRDLVVERLELYEGLLLLAGEPDFDELYAVLFLG